MGLFEFFKKKSAGTSESSEKKAVVVHNTEPKIQKNIGDEEIPTLSSRIALAFPSKNGLYPHEIIMLDYASSFKTKGNTFQSFWKWNYSVLNPQEILDSLCNRGFICRGNAESALKHLKVTELKAILSSAGEKTTGKKEDLVKRILQRYTKEELEEIIPDRNYMLTEAGEIELRENEYVPYLHRHHYMSVWEMNILLNADMYCSMHYRDIIWEELNKQSNEHFRNFSFGLYRNTRFSMHNFLLEEKKYKEALHYLIEVISVDLSGLGNGDMSMLHKGCSRDIIYESRMANFFVSEDNKEVTLPPGIIACFEKIHNELKMQPEDFIEYVYTEFSQIHIPDRAFVQSECANIILSEIGLEKRKISNSYKVAEKRIKEKLGL